MTHAVPGHGTAAGIPPMAPVPQLIIAESGAIDHGRRHAPATSRPHQVGAEDAQKLPTPRVLVGDHRHMPVASTRKQHYFNAQLAASDADPAHRPPVDLFGILIGRVVPPDEKMPSTRARPSPRSRIPMETAIHCSRKSPMVTAGPRTGMMRHHPGAAIVVNQPELGDLTNPNGEMHKHAREIALHHIPALVNEARRSETVSEVKDREYIQSYAFNVQSL